MYALGPETIPEIFTIPIIHVPYSNVIKRIEDQGFSDSLTVSVVVTPQLYLDSLHELHELHHHTRENTIFKLVNMERHEQFYVSISHNV